MSSRSIGFLVLSPGGDVTEHSRVLNDKFILSDTIPIIYLRGVIQTKGKGSIERLHQYLHGNHNIHIYGWTKGAPNTATTHTLPKPIDDIDLYGDILIFSTCAIETNVFVSITENDYIEFFNTMYELSDDIECAECDEEDNNTDHDSQTDECDDDVDDIPNEQCIEIVIYDGELQFEPEYFNDTDIQLQ